jgi:hypothetical protein
VISSQDIQDRFEAFDRQHPEVYGLFVRFAADLLASGRTRGSSDQIMQRIRWESAVNPEKDEGFKINDHCSSRYARKLAAEQSRFEDFFEFRQLRCVPEREVPVAQAPAF